MESEAGRKLTLDLYDQLAQKSEERTDAEKEAVEQTSISIVQAKLKNALAMSIAKARSFENDSLGQQLLKGQELGALDETALRNLQDRIALRAVDQELQDATSNLIQEQISQVKKITADSEKAQELQKKFNSLSAEDLQTKGTVNELLNETSALLSQNSGLTDKQKEALQITLDKLFDENELKKYNLKLTQGQTAEYKEQAKQLDLISQASKRALEAQSFNREIGITRDINANDLRVRALESSKLGASDAQVRQIDQQIAAIKANTVALEQNKEREKIFSQLKSELLENNKIANETTRKIRDNKIQLASTPEALARVAKQVFLQQEDVDKAQQQQNLEKFIQNMNQLFDSFDVSSKIALAVAEDEKTNAGRIAPVIDALEMFRRSLLESSQIIDQEIEDIRLQQLTSISGRELFQANYDIETLNRQRGQTPEDAARIARERQNKSVSQLFNEEFAKTEEERALDLKKTIVDGSVQFKNNMIEGIMSAIEGASSLKDGLRSAAYEFVKTINQRLMSSLVDQVVGGSVQSGSGQTIGGLVGFLSGMFGGNSKASGGMITGGSGTKDDIPAMLMGGEYVVNKKAVSKYGAKFLESLNNGTLAGYAQGGSVQRGPQGNFYTPGTFGQGAIEGKKNLLDFATQTGTTGQFDKIVNQLGYQAIDLEPESSRLSVSGMRNSPQFEATQSAKQQAFDLYLQQYNQEIEAKKAAKEQKKALKRQLLMLAVTSALGAVGSVASTGAKTALANLPKDAGALQKLMTGISGAWKGGKIDGTGQMAGGLFNLFSGDFATAFRSGTPLKAGVAAGSGYGTGTSFSGNVIDNLDSPTWTTEEINKAIKNLNLGEDFDPEYPLLPTKNAATGGMIPSMSGIDTVPAMLSGGEFVMNRSAVQGIGASNLQSMNSGGTSITSEETSKKLNEQLLAKLDELISASGSTGNITINVTPSGQSSQENSQDPSADRQQFARKIKDAVLQIINDEKRIGGSLRR